MRLNQNQMADLYREIEKYEKDAGTKILNETMIETTKKIIKEEGQLPCSMNEWCSALAKTFNINPRRVRRIFRKAGFSI